MELKTNNLDKWLKTLNNEMEIQFGIKDYSKCFSNESWVKEYLGSTIQEVIDDELYYGSQDLI